MTDSERRARFKRIAEARTNKVIKLIRLLGNCSNKSAYLYELDEVRRIFSAIEAEIKTAKSKFPGKRDDKFSLE